ncbi:hypothetical protein MK805_13685 [Shimazuella sp. AN120528]|uniref:hypothetical protein n=1 Tax=Shimazuella soli TaxID=1892854 RepID=UPI001F0CF685|nr:hypothetical protein [Shimazuella soli]MCH5585993.1 hypothetical protein [Shimazuella soli]
MDDPEERVIQLAGEYRTLYSEMTQAVCEQQRKINQLDGKELTQAQTDMRNMSSNYFVCFRAIFDAIPEDQRALFRKHA